MKKHILPIILIFALILSGCGTSEAQKKGYYDDMTWTSTRKDVEKYIAEKYGDYNDMGSGLVIRYSKGMPGFKEIGGFISYSFASNDDLLDTVDLVYYVGEDENKADSIFAYYDKKFTDLYGESDDVYSMDGRYSKKWKTEKSVIEYEHYSDSEYASVQYIDAKFMENFE